MPGKTRIDRLTARWDAVPAERQEAYRRVYQRELRQAGATTDDAAELAVLRRLIAAYQEQALVPVGSRWASVPERVRQAARRGQPLDDLDDPITPTTSGPPRAAILLLVPLIGLLVLALFTFTGGNDETDTLAAPLTPTATATPTPEVSPTPTPLALEESDRFIEAGEGSNRDYFPVLLQVYPADGAPARVFVVQERAVDTADWRFDPNPDVASWVSGLLVQPVFGLPHSEDNAALLADLGPGARFALQMNTGATLDFVYSATRQVTRQQTDVFRQVEPGITLILIGETGEDGLLTEERLVVTGTYPLEQEVERLRAGELAAVVLPGQPGLIEGVDGLQVTVLATDLRYPDGLPDDLAYALVDLDVNTGAAALPTSTLRWLLEDAIGNRYSPDASATALTTFAALPGEIGPHSGLPTSLGFLVPRGLDTAQLLVGVAGGETTAFSLLFEPPPPPITVDALDVQIRSVTYDSVGLYMDVRVFNPLEVAVPLAETAPWLVLGYSAAPIGPQVIPLASNLPAQIEPGTAIDLTLTFPYGGEPFAHLSLLGREYALQITEGR